MAMASEIIGQVRDLLRYHFGNSTRINNSLLNSFIYSTTDPVLSIQSGAKEDFATVSHTPSIYIFGSKIQSNDMNPLKGYTVTVDSTDVVGSNNVDLEAGAVTILCECDYRGQARALAYEVFDYIKKVSDTLATDFSLFNIYPQFSPQDPTNKKTKTTHIFTVNVAWHKFNAWSVT